MNPICPEVIKYINYSKGLDVSLITNGSNLNEDNVTIILKHCTWVRVSLDAGTPKMFKFTHGCNRKMFDKVMEGIWLLTEAKRQNNFKCTIGAAFLTSKNTRGDMLGFTKLCKNLGVDYVQFRPWHWDFTDVTKELERCEEESTDGFQVLKSGNKYTHLGEQRPYSECYGHHFGGVINIHKLYLCCHFRGMPKYELGDLRKDSLEDIWNSERRKEIYENIDYSDCFPVCRCDRFNRILWELKENPPAHINFV
jgi:sulfatase maturation enzyme AslB (radical SAM superfamily)